MNVGVLLHVGFLVEPFAAVMTRERSRVTVNEQMRRQRGRPLHNIPTSIL